MTRGLVLCVVRQAMETTTLQLGQYNICPGKRTPTRAISTTTKQKNTSDYRLLAFKLDSKSVNEKRVFISTAVACFEAIFLIWFI